MGKAFSSSDFLTKNHLGHNGATINNEKLLTDKDGELSWKCIILCEITNLEISIDSITKSGSLKMKLSQIIFPDVLEIWRFKGRRQMYCVTRSNLKTFIGLHFFWIFNYGNTHWNTLKHFNYVYNQSSTDWKICSRGILNIACDNPQTQRPNRLFEKPVPCINKQIRIWVYMSDVRDFFSWFSRVLLNQ